MTAQAKTMAEVLAEHWSASTDTERTEFVDKCDGCGAVLREWGDDSDMPAQLAAHQAAALSAAGFGPVQEARSGALEDAGNAPLPAPSRKGVTSEFRYWLRARAAAERGES